MDLQMPPRMEGLQRYRRRMLPSNGVLPLMQAAPLLTWQPAQLMYSRFRAGPAPLRALLSDAISDNAGAARVLTIETTELTQYIAENTAATALITPLADIWPMRWTKHIPRRTVSA